MIIDSFTTFLILCDSIGYSLNLFIVFRYSVADHEEKFNNNKYDEDKSDNGDNW